MTIYRTRLCIAVLMCCMLAVLACSFGAVKVASASSLAPAHMSPAAVKSDPLFRMYNPHSGEHFYTKAAVERDWLKKMGWHYEGVGWYGPATSKTPVYRLYNANAGDHHYTTSKKESDKLVEVGWRYEGIGWYSDDAKSIAVHRLYNPNAQAGAHHHTYSESERDHLASIGWNKEDVGWYAQAEGKQLVGGDINHGDLATVDWAKSEAEFVNEWAHRIDAYMGSAPLGGYGRVFAQAAWNQGVDPRVSPAISFNESGKGKKCFRVYNAWGWGSKSWSSWEEAINAHIEGLARNYGYAITHENAARYSGSGWGQWYSRIVEQMKLM